MSNHGRPIEATTDLAAPLLRVIDEMIPDVVHDTEQYSTTGSATTTADQSKTPADARSANRPDRVGRDSWPRVHAERSTRSLRTRRRSPPRPSTRRGSLRRTCRGDPTGHRHQPREPRQPIDQHNGATSTPTQQAAPVDRSTKRCLQPLDHVQRTTSLARLKRLPIHTCTRAFIDPFGETATIMMIGRSAPASEEEAINSAALESPRLGYARPSGCVCQSPRYSTSPALDVQIRATSLSCQS